MNRENFGKKKKERNRYEFKECSVCAAKAGSPSLCPSCLNNREVIHYYKSITELNAHLKRKACEGL